MKKPEKKPLAVGDVVVLKSGGPWMTIDLTGANSVRCIWIVDSKKVRSVWFATATVRLTR